MSWRRLIVAGAAAACCLAAQAHGFIERAEPRVGSVVPAAPAEVRIWFSEPLEPSFSTLAVTDAAGRRVDAGRATVDTHDAGLLRVPLTKLGPGTYTAAWRAVSVDTHVTEGRFTFRVAP